MAEELICKKCGSEDIHTRWHEATNCFRCDDCHQEKDCPSNGTYDHLMRYCRGCGYRWDELPLDVGEQILEDRYKEVLHFIAGFDIPQETPHMAETALTHAVNRAREVLR